VSLGEIRDRIRDDPDNAWAREIGYEPIFSAEAEARIVIVGQAPGRKAQETGIPWNDASGVALRTWLGVDDSTFYDPRRIALIPMDFYYPRKGATGDLPPRPGFAGRWHPDLLAELPRVELLVLIGTFAQRHYLGGSAKRNLTETVRAAHEYLPHTLPLVHPSPLNFRWQKQNPWFGEETLPLLRERIAEILGQPSPAS